MDYAKTILEMLERIKTLEEKVTMLENKDLTQNTNDTKKSNYTNLTQKAREYITMSKMKAKESGEKELILLCNDIQKALKVTQRPASICTAMYDSMSINDEVVFAPPKGKSTTLKIKYYLD
ncbi:MAG: hypothetical protein J6K14_05420 [Clostridia bacterium]|nr:hypothetical protein [Clostridia bacterium]